MNIRKSNRTIVNIIFISIICASLVTANILYTMVTKAHFRSSTSVAGYGYDAESTRTLSASRGEIRDRNGEVIAEDVDTYTVVAYIAEREGIGGVPAYVTDVKLTAEKLAPLLDMSVDELLTSLELAKAGEKYLTYFGTKGKNISRTTKEAIEALELPGIEFEASTDRYYPMGKFASHLIGFAKYEETTSNIVGQMGVEQFLNDTLTGKDGEERFRASASGSSLPGTTHVTEEKVDGNNVYLTLDRNVQLALETCLEKTMTDFKAQRAWGMAVEVETGRILAWSSRPTFDLNERDIPDYLNVPADYTYEPGSIMKGITYAAAIDAGQFPADSATFESKEFYIGIDENGGLYRESKYIPANGSIKDAEGKDHGVLSFANGFKLSSNIAICELLSKYFDTADFEEYLDKFGFYKNVGMIGVEEQAGLKNFTYPIDKLTTGFGQGSSVTATQMVQAYSALFNDGKMMLPYYIDRVEDAKTGEVIQSYEPTVVSEPIKKETADKMKDLMNLVMNEKDGTGYWRYHMEDVPVIGKTGTGEVAVNGAYTGEMYINSVMAAAPYDDPKVMMYYAFESKDYKNFTGDPFKDAFRQALIATGVTGSPQDETSVNATWKESDMPALNNHSLAYATSKTSPLGLSQVVIGNGSEVIKQFPESGEKVITGQKVFLLSEGTTLTMPNMSGWSRKDVLTFAQLANVTITIDGTVGSVSEQSVKEGDVINADSEIKVTLT